MALSNLPSQSHLTTLRLDNNEIAYIPAGAFNMTSLEHLGQLSLSYKMIGPQKVNQETFVGLDNLQTLSLAVDVNTESLEESLVESFQQLDGVGNIGLLSKRRLPR